MVSFWEGGEGGRDGGKRKRKQRRKRRMRFTFLGLLAAASMISEVNSAPVMAFT